MEVFTVFRLCVLASGVLLGASLVLGGAQQRKRTRKFTRKYAKIVFLLLALLLIGEPALRSWMQYQTWANDPAARYLLPPYQPWSYFTGYAFFRFWLWRFIGVGVAAILFVLADRFIVQPSAGFKMNRQELALIAFGIAFAGWPYLLVYLVTLLLLYTLILSFFTLRVNIHRRREGASRETRAEPSGHGLAEGEERGGAPSEPRALGGASVVSSDAASAAHEAPRFPVALPATLALLVIPFASRIIDLLNLTVLRVTNLSV